MKFTILQQDLITALQSVARSSSTRAQLPVLANILLSGEAGKLKLSATNLEIGVIKSLNANVIEEGEITVPAKTLVDMVANLTNEELEFTSSGEQLQIKSSSFTSAINGISAMEFPTIPLTSKDMVQIKPEVLIRSLPQVAFAAASDDGRPVLTGILTEIKNRKLQLVGTDGYRLAYKTMDVEEEASFKTLVPRKTFEEVLRLLSEEEMDIVSISTSENQNQIIFQFGNTQISSRLIEGQFPAWEKIIPQSFKARVIAEKSDLLKAVKLASVFARTEANIVRLKNSNNTLTLTSEAKELGRQEKQMEVQSEGDDLEIAFNTKFLQDGLSVINSSQVMIELSGNLGAASIKGMGEDGFQYIIMPVNLG